MEEVNPRNTWSYTIHYSFITVWRFVIHVTRFFGIFDFDYRMKRNKDENFRYSEGIILRNGRKRKVSLNILLLKVNSNFGLNTTHSVSSLRAGCWVYVTNHLLVWDWWKDEWSFDWLSAEYEKERWRQEVEFDIYNYRLEFTPFKNTPSYTKIIGTSNQKSEHMNKRTSDLILSRRRWFHLQLLITRHILSPQHLPAGL